MRYTRLLENVRYGQLGYEPVIIDPTTGAGRLVRDIVPGSGSSAATASLQAPFAALAGGITVFAANDAVNGQELWATDGTSGGTRLVTALQPGGVHTYSPYFGIINKVTGSFAANFANLDATHALFTAYNVQNQQVLWVTDGTAAGTRAVSTVLPTGTDSSAPVLVTALGDGRALFAGYNLANGTELWVTDGTAAGTHIVADLSPSSTISGRDTVAASSNPKSFLALGNGRAMFAASDSASAPYKLWITDGTTAGTSAFVTLNADTSFGGPSSLTRLGNGRVVFENHVTDDGRQLWVTDGTATGTHALITGVTGSFVSLRDNPATGFGVLADGRALFFLDFTNAQNFNVDRQLWVTDGTDGGTRLVRDFGTNTTNYSLAPGSSTAYQRNFVQLTDGRVAFSAGIGANPQEIWVSDGTALGTQVVGHVESINPIGGLSGAQLVDAPFYYGLYGDVATAGVVSATHYDSSGWHEGRDPSAFFSTAGYLNHYRDVKSAGINPLGHYDSQGWKEGRDPSAAFDTTLYLLFNPDVKAAGIDPLAHWLADGQAEGRKMSAVVDSGRIRDLFDPTFYGLGNSDVNSVGADLSTHFNTYGVAEGRNPDAYFDVKYYLAQNPDVAASGINPVAHYLNVGWKEGRDPSTHFSTGKYLAAYADVKAAGINPLQHFLGNGITEGRSGFGDKI